jgi:hypothetical protein
MAEGDINVAPTVPYFAGREKDAMNRRDFLTMSMSVTGAIGAATLPAGAAISGAGAGTREYYELRRYRFRRGPMTQRADQYFRDALIPALRRLGTGPVGVFNPTVGPDSPAAYVLVPHPSAEAVLTLGPRLAADAEYQKAGAPFLNAPASDPSHLGIDSTLLLAFESIPKLEVPANKPRIFELRTYRSHGEPAGLKKIEMFNGGGGLATSEIAIFRRVGLQPVFFGQGILGPDLPSLTYLLTYPDLATRERNWNAFRADPEWEKLRNTPGYTDAEIVSSISNVLLAPTTYSQV